MVGLLEHELTKRVVTFPLILVSCSLLVPVVIINQLPSSFLGKSVFFVDFLIFFLKYLDTIFGQMFFRKLAPDLLVITIEALDHHVWAIVAQMRFQFLVAVLFPWTF